MKNSLHLKAPQNWINDPNGFIYYQGKYHLFYQHFPYAPRWGTMHWGHAVSDDLIHWEHVGVALYPTKYYDSNGVFSGSAIEADGKLYLYYSAVRYLNTDAEDIHLAGTEGIETSQAMIISKDGYHFDNWNGKRQIIPVLTEKQIGDAQDTRDPKVWKADGMYYMILGSRDRGAFGKVLFYRSRDAVEWSYVNQLSSEQFGEMLECPDLFPLDDSYMFVGSPMGITEPGTEYTSHAMWCLVDFQQEDCSLQINHKMQYIDYGMDFYAPQTTLDKEGRRVMIGWMRMPKAVTDDTHQAWNGMMSLPRVIEKHGDAIYFRVHPQVEKCFTKQLPPETAVIGDQPIRIQTTLEPSGSMEIGGYRIWQEAGQLWTDRSRVFAGIKGYRLTAHTPCLPEDSCRLDIYVDRHLIEIFVNEGQYVISHVVYDLQGSLTGTQEYQIWIMEK